MNAQIALPIEEASQVAEARRRAAALLATAGFPDAACGRVALAVTEAATNLLKHGGGGQLLLRPLERGSVIGLELLALDRGPGMGSISSSLRDGFSTAGSLGSGLGAIERSGSALEIYSLPERGTA